MNYYWMYYNTSTGDLSAQHSTHSPYVTSTDSSGNTTQTFDTSLIPPNNKVLGPYDDGDNPMPTDFKKAYEEPLGYLYQNGSYVSNPNYASIQLANAKSAKVAELSSGRDATLSGGFTAKTLVGSATSPHQYPTNAGAQANFSGAVNSFITNTNKTTVMIETLDAGWISHTKTEFYGVYSDGDSWKEAQYSQFNTLEAQVTAATTVSGVQAITWTAASY